MKAAHEIIREEAQEHTLSTLMNKVNSASNTFHPDLSLLDFLSMLGELDDHHREHVLLAATHSKDYLMERALVVDNYDYGCYKD
tara:strand:- start:179 stop:430 length:252 start_codon:yes stop_codon:yes gene_type:complete